MKKIKVYLDTSVIGGCFDEEFMEYSNKLFNKIRSGEYIGVVSDITLDEILDAPDRVRKILEDLPENCLIRVQLSDEMEELTEKYLHERIVTPKYKNDALHIAIATILNIEVLVSWNFKHIVNLQKIKEFNAVNLRENYNVLEIRTPMEVMI